MQVYPSARGSHDPPFWHGEAEQTSKSAVVSVLHPLTSKLVPNSKANVPTNILRASIRPLLAR
ncbi:MAG: hypothetical protein BGO98_27650 [Myxococcales bacterium 68-20]|nr:MAG: hypothetical protein BGO98_27650 [Myxococcales bacterium 68-20]